MRVWMWGCWLAACAPPELALSVPDDLPDEVILRGQTASFNRDWMFAVRDGRIWMAANPRTGRRSGGWELLGATGLPEGSGLDNFAAPEAIAEISADGVHLLALSTDGVLYRATDMQTDVRSDARWTDRWGWPAGRGDGLRLTEDTARGWAASDSHPRNVRSYTDVAGIEHSVGLGVAHAYALAPGGRAIRFSDWWLPNDWSRHICGPEHGALELARLSASGSTLFVLGVDGSLHTRLYDFDTAGENDLYTYSYLITERSSTTRALPAEPWTRQPRPPGPYTDRITIFQDGVGNSARMLRIEGEGGTFEKRIDAPEWDFVETGEPARGVFVEELRPADVPDPWPAPVALRGELTREDSDVVMDVVIEEFDQFCSPWRVRLSDGERTWHTRLHLVHTLTTEQRPTAWWLGQASSPVRGALELPEDAPGVFGDREIVNLMGVSRAGELQLTEIAKGTSFRVPRREKGERGELIELRMSR